MRLPFNLHSKITPSSATAIAVSLLPLIYFLPATRGRLVISPDDGVIFNIPIRAAVANLIRGGYLPLWDPYIFSGMPLFGAAQAGVLFPLNWFYLAFSPAIATNLMMLTTYMVAALGAYLYARRSGSSVAGAALTSLVWQWCGFQLGQIGHTNILHTAALLPWLLWAVDGYGLAGKRSRGVLLSMLVALQIFAGHQQTFSYAILVVVAYALVMWRAGKKSTSQGSQQPQAAYLWSLVFIAAGLGLAAVQILPTAELLRNSLRAHASYDFFTSFSLPPRFLWTFFAPYVFGGGDGQFFRAPYVGPEFYGEYVGYVGVATISLASLAVVLKRNLRTKLWLVIAVMGLGLAFGRFWPFHMYAVVYYTPVLGLFRVPARHLMETEFALAVLAGRGLSAIRETQDRARTLSWTMLTILVVLVLTCLAVTVGRPANFHLGRIAPVSILRAPELFLPIVIAVASAAAIWTFARGRRGATLFLFAVLAFDLVIWGQFSGWRTGSPKADFELWRDPAIVEFLKAREPEGKQPYRILTEDVSFNPDAPAPNFPHGGRWVPALQPDVYMMYGIENAAGYDGFGLARYSRLAGDMKVWGELTDPERTLRGESRELDLLNVRYLLARSSSADSATDSTTPPESARSEFPAATETYGGQHFNSDNLGLAPLAADQRVEFSLPPIQVDHVALLTNLAWSELVPDRAVVADLRLHAKDGQTFDFKLRAGEHTSEWAYDRPDIHARIKHKRAPVATSYMVEDAQTKYPAHTYVCEFALPGSVVITGGEITLERVANAPNLTLSVTRIALADRDHPYPLRNEWVKKDDAVKTAPPALPAERQSLTTPRWQRLAEVGDVRMFENSRALPRAWLASSELIATEDEEINIIRSGKTSDGAVWDPLKQALVEAPSGISFKNGSESSAPVGRAEVMRHEPNRMEVKIESATPAILVLSENHYPGWQATVDGQPVEVMRVNYNQRGVAVKAGSHLVTFVYRPKSVLAGLLISLLTLTALFWWWRQRRFGVR